MLQQYYRMEESKVFHFEPPSNKESQYDLLKDAINTLKKLKYNGFAGQLTKYVEKRQWYVDNYAEKHVQITEHRTDVIDKTNISDDDLQNYEGIIMKIGSEVTRSDAAGLYSATYNINIFSEYMVPISFWHNRIRSHTDNAIVDTGCSRTTFSMQVYDWIKHHYPMYPIMLEEIHVIGGKTTVFKGKISAILLGREYPSLDVYYSFIPHVALIGMDLIKTGKLDIDVGERLTFTYH